MLRDVVGFVFIYFSSNHTRIFTGFRWFFVRKRKRRQWRNTCWPFIRFQENQWFSIHLRFAWPWPVSCCASIRWIIHGAADADNLKTIHSAFCLLKWWFLRGWIRLCRNRHQLSLCAKKSNGVGHVFKLDTIDGKQNWMIL